jgi:hypothetical protein
MAFRAILPFSFTFCTIFFHFLLDIFLSRCYPYYMDSRSATQGTKSSGSRHAASKETTHMVIAIKQAPIQKTVFDLDTMEDVTLVKAVPDFKPAENSHEVLARVGNDSAKMLELLNNGLRLAEREAVASDTAIPFHTFGVDENGEYTDEINGVFAGTIADIKAVNSLKLTLAKTVFGFTKNLSKDEKATAKANALEMIRSTPAIKAGLQKSAALTKSADTE